MNLKKLYGIWLNNICYTLGMDAAKNFDSMLRFHRHLNLKNPRTLADKVSYIELHCQHPLASVCTDKLAVRDYVSQKGLSEILIPLATNYVYGEAECDIDKITFDDYPDQFVLKATHGCKMNYLVSDKRQLNVEKCKSEMHRWLSTT